MIINGNLDLMENYNLISLGNLQIVNGDLNLFDCKNLKDLGKLKVVKNDLNLNDCKSLTTLANLEFVNGSIFLDGSSITKEYVKKYKNKLYYKCIWKVYQLDYDSEEYEI